MAATKRRRHSTKRRSVAKRNPVRRHRKSTTVARRGRRRNFSLFGKTRRRSNPIRRRHVRHRRRRNPIGGGVIGEGFKLAIAGALIGGGQKYVRQLIGGFLPAGPIANAGVTLATGYGLGWLAGMLPVSAIKAFKRPLELAAWTLFGGQLVSSYLLPAIANVTGGAGLSGWNGRRGMRGIGVTTNVPPYLVPTPIAPATAAQKGMQGMAVTPGMMGRY